MNRFRSALASTFALSLSLSLACLAIGCSEDKGSPAAETDTSTSTSTSTSTATGDTSPHTAQHDHPDIVYSGRILREPGKAPRFSAPATTITARFRGTGASALLTDGGTNFFDVVIDGDQAKSTKVQIDRSGTTKLVADLPYGEHTISIVKRNEANSGIVEFSGFVFAGEILPRPPALKRKISIIGDSISAGSGNEGLSAAACMVDFGRAVSNASKSWGPMLARTLDAEYQLTAVSGIGAIRNYACADANTMPKVFDRVFVERANSPLYDHSDFVPDAVLVLLGTNDFSPDDCDNPPLNDMYDPENYAAYIATMKEFVGTLRGYYPEARIFLVASPMLNDGWPKPTYTSDTDHRAAISTVVEDLRSSDDKLELILADYATTRIAGRGCGSHPSLFEHAIMAGVDSSNPTDPKPAQLILNPVKAAMGW